MFKDFANVVTEVKAGFGNPHVLVVGDLMLDRYVWGSVERISPEAPVPVVRVQHISENAGGAGNVAINLQGLGCKVRVAGVVGADEESKALLSCLREHDLSTHAVIESRERSTTVKTRIIGGHQQMLRLDKDERSVISPSQDQSLLEAISSEFNSDISAVVFSDYGKGVLSNFICREVIRLAHDKNIPILVDPKGWDYGKYAGATGISPNRGELAQVVNVPPEDLDLLLERGEKLRATLNVGFIALTLSEMGIALLENQHKEHFPAAAREVFDVSGAGDTVIATMAAALTSRLHLHDCIHLANLAAGIVVGKLGTVPVSREELLAAISSEEGQGNNKILGRSELLGRVAHWRIVGEKVVFTNGCFDILHAGHVALLQQARREGDRLIVAINTDRSVSSLKGPNRPVIREQERARVLAALSSVDAVILFDDETPLQLIKLFRPEVLVKGGDYLEDQVVGSSEVRSWGGKVTLVPLVEGQSTTEVIRRASLKGH